MECTVRWTGLSGMTFLSETGSGHIVAMDGARQSTHTEPYLCFTMQLCLFTTDANDRFHQKRLPLEVKL
jgi:hypothetical protein